MRRVAKEDKAWLADSGMTFSIHALVGGQMTRDTHQKLYLLYPEGNWVDTGSLTPYHVIGSTGYGKPILDRALKAEDSMRHAFKVACLSFDSTRISAADVDFPIDVVLYRRGSFRIVERRFEKHDLERAGGGGEALPAGPGLPRPTALGLRVGRTGPARLLGG